MVMMKQEMLALVALACLATFGAQEYRVPFGEAFAVKERELVDITFSARVAKGASLEAMPDWQPMMTLAACSPYVLPEGWRFASVDLTFADAAGKGIAIPWVTQGPVHIWSREWRAYRHAAYVPDGAAKARVSVFRREKGNEIEIKDLKIVRRDPFKEPSRTVNPDIDFGLFNTSGYSFMGAARWRTTPEGKNWFDLLQGSCYPDPFPVKGGEKLAIRFHGDSPTWLHCYVCFYPAFKDVGKLDMNRKFFVLDVHNKSHHPERVEKVEVPADATWARVYFQPIGKIEDFRVVSEGKEASR